MAKAKRKAKRKRRLGRVRQVSKAVGLCIRRALGQVRTAKTKIESDPKKVVRSVWSELHNIESRLSRLEPKGPYL